MNSKARRTVECMNVNKLIGKNLRYIRKKKKLTLQSLADLAGIKYQQVGKYELGVDQLSAYRIYQFSQIFRVKVKYFFDPTYIDRMNGFHKGREFFAAMKPELLDIDQLQRDAIEHMEAAEVQANL